MSIPTLAPHAAGENGVPARPPLTRYQQLVEVELAISSLEQRVAKLERKLKGTAVSSKRSKKRRRSRRSAWMN
ncbi:MAG: hypothetical protein JOZ81_30175 [Chloroflexi bacterium]|nr:hypothetical protein [Chloroflexota bacterium]